MSQFDFPRIHFTGHTVIDTATANNNDFFPLALYDPVQAKVLLPPRLYLTEAKWAAHPCIPPDTILIKDTDGKVYMEISPISDKTSFIQWAQTPLGNSPLDSYLHPLYKEMTDTRYGKPLKGRIPANWNFYGSMRIAWEQVKVVGVETQDATGDKQHFRADGESCPAEIEEILGADLHLNDANSRSAAIMIDVLPTLPFSTQVFCDQLHVVKGARPLLSARPGKASLRYINPYRIVNQQAPHASSGTFYSAIPLEQIAEGNQAPLLKFFQEAPHKKPLKGLFLRYNLFEVSENRIPDYTAIGPQANPALATIAGSITPWYEGEMASFSIGRLLEPQQNLPEGQWSSPVICQHHPATATISLDLVGNIPEIYSANPTQPYQVFDLGELIFKVADKQGQLYEFGRIRINEEAYPRSHFLETGGMVDVSYADHPAVTPDLIEAGTLMVFCIPKDNSGNEGQEILLMQESELMVGMDQTGLYANQGDHPVDGYMTDGVAKQPCRIRIFSKGQPVHTPVELQVVKYDAKVSGFTYQFVQLTEGNRFVDGMALEFPLDEPANTCYLFLYKGSVLKLDIIASILKTGAIANLRVLPAREFSHYGVQSTDPLTFEVLYAEIFRTYDLLYPITETFLPYTATAFSRNPDYLRKLMSYASWGSFMYMPSSRDMSDSERDLINRWIDGLESI